MDARQKAIKYKCENSLLFFARYIYKENHNRKFIMSKHFEEIAKFLESVYYLEITRGVINIPPRYGKTELIIKLFTSWCIAKVPTCKFIHLSYSDSLALDNLNIVDQEMDFNKLIGDFETKLIINALRSTGGNKKEAARLLKLKRTTLLEKIKKKNLQGNY